VVDKILRNPAQYPAGLSVKSLNQMGDLLNGRVVVSFMPHLMLVDRELKSRSDLTLWGRKKPRAYLRSDDAAQTSIDLKRFEHVPKQWGAAALIYWLSFTDDVSERVPFELQVVTLLDDAWGKIQRQMGHRAHSEIKGNTQHHFNEIGALVSELDSRLTNLYDELTEYQREGISSQEDSPLNAENLPRLLSQVNIECAQIELEGMLKVLASRGVVTVRDLHGRATPETVAKIRSTYVNEAGWPPSSFELVATLAMLGPHPEAGDVTAAARLNMEYLEAWDETQRESQALREGRPDKKIR
jgi:ppGpp synthetase/RelA/SpoT-type nucleotidyltranferase